MKISHSFHRGSHSGLDKHTNKTKQWTSNAIAHKSVFPSLIERWRGVDGGITARLWGSVLGKGGGGGHRVSGGSSQASPQARYFWAKGFQEQKINVNLRPPGRVNRTIMELYTPTHPHTDRGDTHLQKAGTHNKYTYTYTNCPGIICTVGECFVFCSHCCRRSERMTGWAAEERETERSKKKNRQ